MPAPIENQEMPQIVRDMRLQAELNHAIACGWTNLVDAGGSLVGTPPDGAERSRGQAAVPRWTSDWAACGPVMVHLRLIWMINGGFAYAGLPRGDVLSATPISDHADIDTAVRYALITAATTRLIALATTMKMAAGAS